MCTPEKKIAVEVTELLFSVTVIILFKAKLLVILKGCDSGRMNSKKMDEWPARHARFLSDKYPLALKKARDPLNLDI